MESSDESGLRGLSHYQSILTSTSRKRKCWSMGLGLGPGCQVEIGNPGKNKGANFLKAPSTGLTRRDGWWETLKRTLGSFSHGRLH
ncbi:hypothetical protein V2G26_010061 [Clonostachys chloroleuca]